MSSGGGSPIFQLNDIILGVSDRLKTEKDHVYIIIVGSFVFIMPVYNETISWNVCIAKNKLKNHPNEIAK